MELTVLGSKLQFVFAPRSILRFVVGRENEAVEFAEMDDSAMPAHPGG